MSRLTPGERLRRDEMFRQGMLWCSGCEQFHPVKDFKKYQSKTKQNTNYGYRFYCQRCDLKKFDKRKETMYQQNNQRNAARKAQFAELGGGRCQRCGYSESYAALEFHHVYPAEKKYDPTRIMLNGDFEKTWRELDKCCLLCSNCHRTYKANEWKVEFVRRGNELLGFTVGASLPLDDNRYETTKPPKYDQAPLPLFATKRVEAQLKLFESPTSYVA